MGKQKQTQIRKEGCAYWQEEVRKLKKSGLTIAAYCRKTGVKSDGLYKWRTRLKKESRNKTKGFIELPSSIYASTHIVESYDIYLQPSPHIRIGACFNPDTLKHLIDVLKGV